MATTYTLIESQVLGSSATSVEFLAIPDIYTDLVLKASVRNDDTGASYFRVYFNNETTGTNYSQTYLYGNGATAGSSKQLNNNYGITVVRSDSSSDTSNTFASVEIYIPSYTASQSKSSSTESAMETNSATAYMNAIAGLWNNTDAITSIQCSMAFAGGPSFVTGSSFYLYGISNS